MTDVEMIRKIKADAEAAETKRLSDEEIRKKQKADKDALERPEHIKKEYQYVLGQIKEIAAKLGSSYEYKGQYNFGVCYKEIIEKLITAGFQVVPRTYNCERVAFIGDKIQGTGEYYTRTDLTIRW